MRVLVSALVVSSAVLGVVARPLLASADAGAGSASAPPPDADPRAWFAARGVEDTANLFHDPSCFEVVVGSASEHALQCIDATTVGVPDTYSIAVSHVIYVVRAGKAVAVLDAWTLLQNLDRPRQYAVLLAVELSLAKDGRSAVIADSTNGQSHCGGLGSHDDDRRSGEQTYRVWMDRICDGRGTYRWRDGRFVRAAH